MSALNITHRRMRTRVCARAHVLRAYNATLRQWQTESQTVTAGGRHAVIACGASSPRAEGCVSGHSPQHPPPPSTPESTHPPPSPPETAPHVPSGPWWARLLTSSRAFSTLSMLARSSAVPNRTRAREREMQSTSQVSRRRQRVAKRNAALAWREVHIERGKFGQRKRMIACGNAFAGAGVCANRA